MSWIPTAYDLRQGCPFAYSERAISLISGTEAFNTGINICDARHCIVCGISIRACLEHTHIVPKVGYDTWDELRCAREDSFLLKQNPSTMKFAMLRRFVLINHSNIEPLREYHGRAVRLFPGDSRMPFHGAFLIHEMRARGFCPFADDPTIRLPISWQRWIQLNPDGDGSGDNNNDNDNARDQVMGEGSGLTSPMIHVPVASLTPNTGQQSSGPSGVSSSYPNTRTTLGKTLTFTNPFANPTELESLKRSFAQQPNWKAAQLESVSWEGTADENIQKYRAAVE